jgi:hypothetical protein
MLRASFTTVPVLFVLLFAAPAAAQKEGAFGEQGQAIVSVDRLMPLFAYESYKQGDLGGGGVTDTNTITSVSFVGHGLSIFGYGGGAEPGLLLYNVPRFAFDYTVWQHLTVGGSVWAYFQLGNSATFTDRNGVSTTTDNAKVSFWGLGPRAGWILHLSDLFAFWPRGGVSFNDASVTFASMPGQPTTTGTVTQWAIDLEPMFVITPVPHAGITVGGAVDIPFAGSLSSSTAGTTVSVDSTQFQFGLNAGLLVWF